MQMFRLALAVGMMVIGGIAVFMGLVVTGNALSKGAIVTSVMREGIPVVTTLTRSDDADAFWQTVGLIGIAPTVLGALGIIWGRRILKG